MKTAIVIGVGPDRGLGARLCKRFAADGLKVIVAGRTLSALQAVAGDIEQAGGTAVPFVADATSEGDIAALFDAAGENLDLAVYNAGNNTPGKIIEMEADYFEQAWRVVCFGGFLFGREAVRRMAPKKSGKLLFTGASASLRGRPGYGAFNSAKAGLRTLAQAMAKEIRARRHPCLPCRGRRRDRGRQDFHAVSGCRRSRGQPDRHRRHRRCFRLPLPSARTRLVVRARRADVKRKVVGQASPTPRARPLIQAARRRLSPSWCGVTGSELVWPGASSTAT